MKKFILSVMALFGCGQMMAMSYWNREMLVNQLESGLRQGIGSNADQYAQNRSTTNTGIDYSEEAKWRRAYTAYALENIKKGASWEQFLRQPVVNSALHDAIALYYTLGIEQERKQEEKITNDIKDICSAISQGAIALVVKKDDSQ
jgi:hypothetical protein